ncbi:hypothetical protein EYC84_009030 [Monilinia fructicola]|uniref:Uncharacterized protein n=1 Tax=Monilinia fructicola TaxID=38448 RepID=A0A5M9JCL1_MONFR|nr:hypothetical protein EYC84_009030 [Monilinia fructicola]
MHSIFRRIEYLSLLVFHDMKGEGRLRRLRRKVQMRCKEGAKKFPQLNPEFTQTGLFFPSLSFPILSRAIAFLSISTNRERSDQMVSNGIKSNRIKSIWSSSNIKQEEKNKQ